jgi:predicted metal-dependent peptidase
MVQAGPMDVAELRRWIEDALTRHQRDARERDETLAEPTADEVVDAVWGRLPLAVRREVSRAQVQASLTMLTLRHRFGGAGPDGDASAAPERPELAGSTDFSQQIEN